MLGYQALDSIADAFNPVFLLASLLLPTMPAVRQRTGALSWYALLGSVLAIVYAVMWLDSIMGVWHRFGSDYSTHSAFAVALTVVWSRAGKICFAVATSATLLYLALILFQRYHTVIDVFTSAATVGTAAHAVNAMASRVGRAASRRTRGIAAS